MRIRAKIFVLQLISYAQRARERRQTCSFSQTQPITQTSLQLINVQRNFAQ